MIERGDGLITYTSSGADYWRARGMAPNRVIPYFNTLDVQGLREAATNVKNEDLERVRRRFTLEGKHVLLFSGRLYPEKQVDFLLEAFSLLQRRNPNVALLILGDGSEREMLEKLCDALNLRQVHFLGEHHDPIQVSVYFQLADLLVIPGLVGLAIVHGFAHGLPIVTTDHDLHSPEIEYLSKENGIQTSHEEKEFADAIGKVLGEKELLASMQLAARRRGDQLTLCESVKRFMEAILTLSAHKGTGDNMMPQDGVKHTAA